MFLLGIFFFVLAKKWLIFQPKKFCKQDFRALSVLDNLLNLGIYNYFGKHKPCFSCETYSKYCEEVLKEECRDGWGDFDFVIGKIKNCDISLSI